MSVSLASVPVSWDFPQGFGHHCTIAYAFSLSIFNETDQSFYVLLPIFRIPLTCSVAIFKYEYFHNWQPLQLCLGKVHLAVLAT